MFKRLQGKGKIILNKEDFQDFFYTFLNYMSEEWKEIKDKTIKLLKEHNELLKKENQKMSDLLGESREAYNKHIHISNILGLKYQETILDLKKEIRVLKKEAIE